MSLKPKFRFFVSVDGNDTEIGWAKENRSGNVVFRSRFPKYFLTPQNELVRFKEQHYSVHPSNEDTDTTITQKTVLVDGQTTPIVSFIQNTNQHLLWPIFARRLPIFIDPPSSTIRSKDVCIRLEEYQSTTHTLYYSMFATRPTYNLPKMPKTQTQIDTYRYDFRLFSLILLATLVPVPSIPQGDVVGITTSVPAQQLGETQSYLQLPQTSFPKEVIFDLHGTFLQRLTNLAIWRSRGSLTHERPE
jgi:hypothetical protein